jgi:hypothetical protein
VRRSERVPASGSSRPASSPQQRRFPGAVGADQADALAGPEVEGKAGEQWTGAVGFGQILDAHEDGHARLRSQVGVKARACLSTPLLMVWEGRRVGKGSPTLPSRFCKDMLTR